MSENSSYQAAISQIVRFATPSQSAALEKWLEQLLEIRLSPTGNLDKLKRAMVLTADSKVLLPILKMIALNIKMHGWDNRTPAQRRFIAGASIGLAIFGNSGAGIAAFGTAIGVPAWIVLGAGSMFAQETLDRLRQHAPEPTKDDIEVHTVIDVKPIRSDGR